MWGSSSNTKLKKQQNQHRQQRQRGGGGQTQSTCGGKGKPQARIPSTTQTSSSVFHETSHVKNASNNSGVSRITQEQRHVTKNRAHRPVQPSLLQQFLPQPTYMTVTRPPPMFAANESMDLNPPQVQVTQNIQYTQPTQNAQYAQPIYSRSVSRSPARSPSRSPVRTKITARQHQQRRTNISRSPVRTTTIRRRPVQQPTRQSHTNNGPWSYRK